MRMVTLQWFNFLPQLKGRPWGFLRKLRALYSSSPRTWTCLLPFWEQQGKWHVIGHIPASVGEAKWTSVSWWQGTICVFSVRNSLCLVCEQTFTLINIRFRWNIISDNSLPLSVALKVLKSKFFCLVLPGLKVEFSYCLTWLYFFMFSLEP